MGTAATKIALIHAVRCHKSPRNPSPSHTQTRRRGDANVFGFVICDEISLRVACVTLAEIFISTLGTSSLLSPFTRALRFKRQRQRRDRSRRSHAQLAVPLRGLVACDRPPATGRRALIAHASPTLAAVVAPIEDPPEGGFAQLAAGRLTVGRPLHRMLCSRSHSIRDGRGERSRDGLRAEKASVLGLDSLLRVETCGQLSTEQLCGGR